MAKKKARHTQQGLVLGRLERISSAAFVSYSEAITELVGGRNGIYALYRNKQLYYVGLATDLKRRIKQHLKDRHAGKWNYFSLYLVRSEKFLKDLESLAIRVAFPKGNKIKGKFGGAPNLRPSLKKRMKQLAGERIVKIMGRGRSEAVSKKPKAAKAPAKKKGATPVPPLKGLISRRKRLRATYKGKDYKALVLPSGRIRLAPGELYNSPGAAAEAVRKRPTNGWTFWRYLDEDGEWQRLTNLRK